MSLPVTGWGTHMIVRLLSDEGGDSSGCYTHDDESWTGFRAFLVSKADSPEV